MSLLLEDQLPTTIPLGPTSLLNPQHQLDLGLVVLRQRKLYDLGQDTDPLCTPRRSDILKAVTTALGFSDLFSGPAATLGQGPGRSVSPATGTWSAGKVGPT